VGGGLFTVDVEFGPRVLNGYARWLEVKVMCPGDSGLAALTPRVPLMPAPYAMALPGLWTEHTSDTQAPNLIAGYRGNSVDMGTVGASIGGGGQRSFPNSIIGNYGTIGGGDENTAGFYGTVAGGDSHRAVRQRASVGGGNGNSALADFSTVGGGQGNSVSGTWGTIAGGYQCSAPGDRSHVPGGSGNIAGGDFSMAAGRRARVRSTAETGENPAACGNPDTCGDEGTFAWGDSTAVNLSSTGPNQFLVRASGGLRLTTGDGSNPRIQAIVPSTDTPRDLALQSLGGNVGIGTTMPTAKLHLAGTAGVDGIRFPDGTLQTTAGGGSSAAWNLNGNSGTTPGTQYLGTTDNVALNFRVNNQRVMRFEPSAIGPNVLGGFSGNTITSGVIGATIAGGGQTDDGGGGPDNNRVTDEFGTIGGGRGNQAGDNAGAVFDRVNSTVGGGYSNTASGYGSTVGGGEGNTADGSGSTVGGGGGNTADGSGSTVGGGQGNSASGGWSTVGGGQGNTAMGLYSAVPGGYSNEAGGDYSLAGGHRAKVRDAAASGDADGDEGTFVWADSTDADFTSSGPDQFLIRAAGGVGINTNSPTDPLTVNGVIRSVTGGFEFPDGTLQTTAATGGGGAGNTLDQAYDQGGPGAGRTITADAGAVNIAGTAGLTVNGTVGIGTTSPGAGVKLHVKSNGNTLALEGTDHAYMEFYPDGLAAGRKGWLGYGDSAPSDTELRISSEYTDGYVVLMTEGTRRLIADSSGRVGIGKYPVMTLDVNGPAFFEGNSMYLRNPGAPAGMQTWGAVVQSANGNFLLGRAPDSPTVGNLSTTNLAIFQNGNIGIGNAAPTHPLHMGSGAHCTAGGAWTNASSRELKENFAQTDVESVLLRLAALPIRSWNYRKESAGIRHIGPTAEEFHEAFRLGGDDESIATIDADGVALAAIQGLHQVVQEKDCAIVDLQSEISDLRSQNANTANRNAELEARLARIERMIGVAAPSTIGGE